MTPGNNQRVTIKHVAREAGVSTQTVSRVINDRPDVAPETRRRVLAVIERLGYRPNVIARSLIQKRSFTLGVVTAGLKYIGPSRTLNGITAKAETLGYTLVLEELADFGGYDVNPIVDRLLARQVDGIIWAVTEMEDNRAGFEGRLHAIPVPIVFLTMRRRPDWPIVAVNNYAGGRLATQHLLDRGHSKIGHISGPLTWWEARRRKEGWEDVLVEAGLAVEQQHWCEGNWSPRSGARAISCLLDRSPDMTAVFVGNDQMALAVLHHCQQSGRRVPEDLAVVGFDNIAESAYFCPPLTTIQHDQHQLGCTAVQEVVRMIEAGYDPVQSIEPHYISIQPELVVRASSGQPRS